MYTIPNGHNSSISSIEFLKKTGTHKYIYLKKEKKAIISARMNEFSLYQTMCDEDQNFYPINELPVE